MTVRADLAAALKPHLPKSWKIVPFSRDTDVIDKHLVMLVQESIERSAAAPHGAVKVGFKVYIIEPKIDPETAEDALDDAVTDLLLALNKSRQVYWERADRATWKETNPAYEVTVSYYAIPETEGA